MPQKRPLDLAHTITVTGESGRAADEVEASFRVPEDRSAAAFFDVDNTIMRGASIFQLVRGFASEGLISIPDLVSAFGKQARFVLQNAEDMDDMHDATEAALEFVKGRKVSEIVKVAEHVFDEYMVDKLWPGTLALAQSHLDAGQRVWVVSATPVELAQIIARRLGFTGGLGTVAETDHGVYTGKLVGSSLHGAKKADAIRDLAEREGLDLSRCSAYSDSSNDIPMLSVVGHPVAVNPDGELRAYAKEHGWVIRDYRRRRLATQGATVLGASAAAVTLVGGVVILRKKSKSA